MKEQRSDNKKSESTFNMNGKDNIIANILSAAEAEKSEIMQAAQEKADELARADQAYKEELERKMLADGEQNEKTAIARGISVANMDVKKLLLQAKQEKLSEVFEKAEQAILSMDDESYLRFILSLLAKYAESGDTVVVCSADKARVSEDAVLAFASKKGLSLSYRADGAFSGGVLLESEQCDKNLTVSILLKEYRESHETEVAAILAGE